MHFSLTFYAQKSDKAVIIRILHVHQCSGLWVNISRNCHYILLPAHKWITGLSYLWKFPSSLPPSVYKNTKQFLQSICISLHQQSASDTAVSLWIQPGQTKEHSEQWNWATTSKLTLIEENIPWRTAMEMSPTSAHQGKHFASLTAT